MGEENIEDIWTGGRERNWRKGTNSELREMYKDLDIVTDIKHKKLEWIGHVVGMDHGRTVKKILESKSEGSRKRGRPRLRWLKDVEKDRPEMTTEGS